MMFDYSARDWKDRDRDIVSSVQTKLIWDFQHFRRRRKIKCSGYVGGKSRKEAEDKDKKAEKDKKEAENCYGPQIKQLLFRFGFYK